MNERCSTCQQPLSTRYWAGWVGRHLGPWLPHRDLAWNGTDWTAASAEGLARRESSVFRVPAREGSVLDKPCTLWGFDYSVPEVVRPQWVSNNDAFSVQDHLHWDWHGHAHVHVHTGSEFEHQAATTSAWSGTLAISHCWYLHTPVKSVTTSWVGPL
jgi:hypothetical protein